MTEVIKFRSNGVNLSAQIGRAVLIENDDATGRSSGLINLAGAAAGTAAARPIGILVSAEDALNGECTVCVHGFCLAMLGGAITQGANTILKSDAASEMVAAVATDAVWSVGYFLPERGSDGVDGRMARIFVNPQRLPHAAA